MHNTFGLQLLWNMHCSTQKLKIFWALQKFSYKTFCLILETNIKKVSAQLGTISVFLWKKTLRTELARKEKPLPVSIKYDSKSLNQSTSIF